jgi:hypothetical protein
MKDGRPVACDLPEVRAVAAAPPERRERAGLRREQRASNRMKARQKHLITPTGSGGILE